MYFKCSKKYCDVGFFTCSSTRKYDKVKYHINGKNVKVCGIDKNMKGLSKIIVLTSIKKCAKIVKNNFSLVQPRIKASKMIDYYFNIESIEKKSWRLMWYDGKICDI